MPIDVRDRREQRKFGLVMAGALTVLALVRWGLRGHAGPSLFAAAAVFMLLALAAPRVLQPVFAAWMLLADFLNRIVTGFLLGLVYLTMIVPGRLILSLLRKDPLKRNWEPLRDSYWEEAEEQPEDPDRYLDSY